jgi:replicative DNA helicase
MLTTGFEKNNIFSLWFAYEVPPKQLIKRFPNLPLFYFPETIKDRVISYLDKKIKEAKDKYGVKIIFIDHLHYLLDLSRITNASIQIGQLIRSLKILAMKHEIIIFLAAHTTKLLPDKEPSADDIRDSSFVSQESDGVMILWRVKGVLNESRLKIEYHRRIGLIDKIIPFIFANGELREKC